MATDLQQLPQALPAVPPNDAKAIYINKQKIKVFTASIYSSEKKNLYMWKQPQKGVNSQRKVP